MQDPAMPTTAEGRRDFVEKMELERKTEEEMEDRKSLYDHAFVTMLAAGAKDWHPSAFHTGFDFHMIDAYIGERDRHLAARENSVRADADVLGGGADEEP